VDVDASAFPADDLGYGFDSIGDALTFSTLHLEKYMSAASDVADEVFHGENTDRPVRREFAAGAMRLRDDRGATMRSSAFMYTFATIEQTVVLPRAGIYRLRVEARGQQAGDEPARMQPVIDGHALRTIDVAGEAVKEYSVEVRLAAGQHEIALSFVNDFFDPTISDRRARDRNLEIERVTIEGPVDTRSTPRAVRWLHAASNGRDASARLRGMLQAALPRLWRRAVTLAEVERLAAAGARQLEDGGSLLGAQRFVLTAALTSPHFLFRTERGDAGSAEVLAAERATRLAYFLWASAPDDLLRARAAAGDLDDPVALAAEVDRMLADPRADRLASDFAGQWLELRSLKTTQPDPDRYPFDDGLRASLARETQLLFSAVLRERRDVRELVDCDLTYLDARLAAHSGLPHEGAQDEFVRTQLRGAA
ncbi:MAG: DUF1592 domain-containing protein, partial [Planctomycetota bacterium]|nr:DUF1592 domain-containing protein [Planctomycetota bacterium]